MEHPKELKYTSEHEWLRDNEDGTATIGITDFAQSELGDIFLVYLLEDEFEISVSIEDLDFERFSTVENISEFVMNRLSQS